jgi:hypothetical protein
MIAGLGMMCLSSSVGAALMMGGGEDDGGADSAGANNNDQDDECDEGYKKVNGDCTSIFSDKTIAATSTYVDAGYELTHNQRIESPNDQKYMYMQGDNNLCSGVIENGSRKNKVCLMSHQVGGTAKMVFQDDGNICVVGDTTKCWDTADTSVPSGQHRLVVTNAGEFYVDHGDGKTSTLHGNI